MTQGTPYFHHQACVPLCVKHHQRVLIAVFVCDSPLELFSCLKMQNEITGRWRKLLNLDFYLCRLFWVSTSNWKQNSMCALGGQLLLYCMFSNDITQLCHIRGWTFVMLCRQNKDNTCYSKSWEITVIRKQNDGALLDFGRDFSVRLLVWSIKWSQKMCVVEKSCLVCFISYYVS